MDKKEVINLANDATDRVTAAIREIGAEAMGVAEIAEVRKNTLDELAQALGHLDTLRYVARGCVRSADVQEKTAGTKGPLDPTSKEAIEELIASLKRCGFSPEIQREVVRVVFYSLDGTWVGEEQTPTDPSKTEGAAEKQPGALSGGDHQTAENGVHNADVQPKTAGDGVIGGDHETAKPAEPFKVFQTEDEFVRAIADALPRAQQAIRDLTAEEWDAKMKHMVKRDALKASLLGPDEIYLEEGIIRKVHAALEDALEEMPTLSGEGFSRCLESLNWAWTNTRMVLSWSTPKEPDIDLSDNDAETAGKAENGSNGAQHRAAQEGGAA